MNGLKKRILSLGLALLWLAGCCLAAHAEDEEVYFADIPQTPTLSILSPAAGESYAGGGTLHVQATGQNVGFWSVAVTSQGGVSLSETQAGGSFDYTFQLPAQVSEALTVTVVGYAAGEAAGLSARQELIVPSPKAELITRMLALAYQNSKEKKYKFAPAESDTDIGVCKNFVMRLFDTYAKEYKMAAYPDLPLHMPKNNRKVDCAPYDYGIEWKPETAAEGSPFEIAAQFKYDNALFKEENAAAARAMLEQVQKGDFFQMVGNYGGGNGPHSLLFMADYDPATDMLHWTDSNMRGKRVNGVRWGYLQYDADATAQWFIDCINMKKRGATLYRLRDDLYKP